MSGGPFTIPQLARAVLHSDGINICTTQKQLEHVLEIAVKNLGINCLGGRTVGLDIGNGHVLQCTVKETAGAAQS